MTNTWTAKDGQFATRITLNDIPGFFSKQLVIGAGTKALVIDDGTYLGEVSQGTYTLQSFTEKLQFWKSPKKIDVLLVQEQDLPISFYVDKIATAEDLLVAVKLGLVVQIRDIGLFARNYLGGRDSLSIGELKTVIAPIIGQALKDTIRQLSMASLCSPEVRPMITIGIQDVSKTSLSRYGISCEDVQTIEIANEQYDEQRKKTGEIWLLDQSTQQQRALGEVLDRDTLMKIERQEREVELNVLAENVRLDSEESEVALKLRRNEVRKKMRDAVNSDLFDQAKTKEEFRAFLLEIDKQKLIREDERHELENLYEAKREDREAARELIVRKLELQRNAELNQLSLEIAHAEKIKTLQHEIELTKLTDDEEARRWREMLQLESEKSEKTFQEQLKTLQRQQELNSKHLQFMRAEEWDQLQHRQKTSLLEAEIREETIARDVRTRRITDEYEDEQKRRERDLNNLLMDDNMKRLEAMQRMRMEREQFKLDLVLKAKAQQSAQEIEKLNTQSRMSVEALIATSDSKNAELLAGVQISKNESEAQARLREEAAYRERELQEQRVREAQQANKAAMDAIQNITSQAFGAMGQVGSNRPAYPAPGYGGPVDPAVPRVAVCNGCRAENTPGARFCANCGKEL